MVSNNRPGNKLGEESYVKQVVRCGSCWASRISIDINEIADFLKGEKRNTNWKSNSRELGRRKLKPAEDGYCLLKKKITVFVIKQKRQVIDYSNAKQCSSLPSLNLSKFFAQKVIRQRAKTKARNYLGRAPGVT